jgi:Fibronectin type III domain
MVGHAADGNVRQQRNTNTVMTLNYRVSLGFTGLPDSDLDEFCANVILKMTGNAAFPAPPVTLADLAAQRLAFHNAIATAMQGGRQLTAAKNAARAVVLASLRALAAYVQSLAFQDLTLLLSSGFLAASTNRASVPLDTPVILAIDNTTSGQLQVRLDGVANAAAYQIRCVATGGPNPVPVTVEDTNTRAITVPDLVPGTVYSLQARAIGGADGYSDWSNPTTCMAT